MFSGAIGANLVRGRRPPCRCFGQLHSGRIGWPTLGRNAVLAIIASLIAWQGGDVAGPSAVGWILDLSVGEGAEIGVGLVGFALLAVEGWVLLYLLRRYGALLNRLGSDGQPGASNGLAVGTPAPAFSLPDLSEKMVSLDALRRVGKPLALVFIDLSCPHCAELLPDVGRWQRDHSADLTTVVIGSGDMQALRNASAAHGLIQMLVQEDEHLVDAYRVLGNPAAVVIHPDGTIDSPVVLGTSAIRDLIAGHLKRRSSRQTGEARDQTTGRGPGQGKTAPLLPLEF
ncbi:MAG: peroxiredoxin family protein [Haloechinothrix sp.]